ncbi:AAA family ATPase [Arcicella rosea]|uniref:Putative ATPase n=1 Tax=Arcicella rosea TaxID=502909 RepID=A0A841EL32_9BACT|nr:AAA family ATPase [Arcicella rosea]MBB6004312.1 putative ATPase [Arcicella rosea]
MLRKVRIQNFKSLKDVTLELQKVNLLIGPNNSGKSNFLKGLESMNYDFESMNNQVRSRLEFKSKSIIYIHIIADKSDYLGVNINTPYINFYNTSQKTPDKDIWLSEKMDTQFTGSSSYSKTHIPNLKDLKFTSIIYKPDPNTFTKPASLDTADSLLPDCSNLVPFLFNLGQNHKKLFKTLEDNLGKCVGDLVSIGTPAEGNKLRLKFFDKDDNDYWADEVSEGVLYFLALLCIIHQPNPPKLLLLEEPEKGIHPRRIREVIDFIFQLVEEKDIQVIMTTHSERVLDEFEDIPESVIVFDKDEEGATQVKNLLKDIIEPSNIKMESLGLPRIKFTESLGSHWVTGFIGGVPK